MNIELTPIFQLLKSIIQREIKLVYDATFYAKRKDKIRTLVFKDTYQNEVLIWKHIQTETVKEYKDLKQKLKELGYTIKSVTFDGKRGFNIEELTVNPVTGECFYKHQKLRATYRSLRANLQYLFTCKNYKNLKIANTTNNLDRETTAQ